MAEVGNRRASRNQRRWLGWLLRVATGLLYAIIGVLAVTGVLIAVSAVISLDEWVRLPSYVTVALGGLALPLFLVTVIMLSGAVLSLVSLGNYRARQHLARTGTQALSRDARAPVLYLRSFQSDSNLSRSEELLARTLNEVGPFVAIGRPGEFLPPVGAARFYVPQAEWQGFVIDLISRCRLVILVPGRTVGLSWELARCRELLGPDQIVLLAPHDDRGHEVFYDFARETLGLELPPADRLRVDPAEGQVVRESECPVDRFVAAFTFRPDWSGQVHALRRAPRVRLLDWCGAESINDALAEERSLRALMRTACQGNAEVSLSTRPTVRDLAFPLLMCFTQLRFLQTIVFGTIALIVVVLSLLGSVSAMVDWVRGRP